MDNFLEDAMDFSDPNESSKPVKSNDVIKTAIISPCKKYRYILSRSWNDYKPGELVFIMLNPSTADDTIDDPTIRRCMGFSKREGYSGISVINLFAYRATNPQELYQAEDPIGEDNNPTILNYMLHAQDDEISGIKKIICAWGTHGSFNNRDKDIIQMAKEFKIDLYCLGKTKDGHPKHPLYIKKDQPIEIFKKYDEN